MTESDDELIDRIQQELQRALAQKYGHDDLEVHLDRETSTWQSNREIDFDREKRLVAQTVKMAIIGRARLNEREYAYYASRVGQVVEGMAARFEGANTIVHLEQGVEGIVIPTEGDTPAGVGDRIRCIVLDVEAVGSRVKVLLTRA